MREPSRRILFLNDLAALVDGDEEAIRKHEDLIGENEAVASLRADAEALASRIGEAGADYKPPVDLEARLRAAITRTKSRVTRPSRKRERTATRPLYQLNPKSTPPASGGVREIEVVVLDSHPDTRLTLNTEDQHGSRQDARAQYRPLILTIIVILCALAAWVSFPYARQALERMLNRSTPQEAPKRSPVATPHGRYLALFSVEGRANEGLNFLDRDGQPLEKAKGLGIGQSLESDLSTSAHLNDDAGLSIQVAPGTHIGLVSHDVLQVRGAARIRLPANASDSLALQTEHGEVRGQGAWLIIRSDRFATQVLVLRGEVTVEPKQASAVHVQAQETLLMPLRGAVTKAPLADALPWLAPFAPTPSSALGAIYIAGADDEAPLRPSTHEVQLQIFANHALVQVTELFSDAHRAGAAHYQLPLTSGATPLDIRVGWEGEMEQPTSNNHDLLVPSLHAAPTYLAVQHAMLLNGSPLKIHSRYLLPVMRDSQGEHLRYKIDGHKAEKPALFSLQATLLEAGHLSANDSEVEAALDGRVLRLPETRLSEAIDLTIELHRQTGMVDGSVYWSTWPTDFEPAAPSAYEVPPRAHAAALRLQPLPPHARPPRPQHVILVVDCSATTGQDAQVMANALGDELRLISATESLLSVLHCNDECRIMARDLEAYSTNATLPQPSVMQNAAVEGGFNLSGALEAANSLASSTRDRIKIAPLPAHVVVVTDEGVSSGSSNLDALAQHLSSSTPLSLVSVGPKAPRGLVAALAHLKGGVAMNAPDETTARSAAWSIATFRDDDALVRPQLYLQPGGTSQGVALLPTLSPGGTHWILLPSALANGHQAVLTATMQHQPFERSYAMGQMPALADNAVQSALLWLQGFEVFQPLEALPALGESSQASPIAPDDQTTSAQQAAQPSAFEVDPEEAQAAVENVLSTLVPMSSPANTKNTGSKKNADKERRAEQARLQAALEAARSELNAHPYSAHFREQFSKALCATDEQDICIQSLEDWLKQQPLQTTALALLTRAQLRAGRLDEASKTLASLADIKVEQSELHAALGDLLWLVKHKGAACAHLRWAAEHSANAQLTERADSCQATLDYSSTAAP